MKPKDAKYLAEREASPADDFGDVPRLAARRLPASEPGWSVEPQRVVAPKPGGRR